MPRRAGATAEKEEKVHNYKDIMNNVAYPRSAADGDAPAGDFGQLPDATVIPGAAETDPQQFDTRFGGELTDEQKNFLDQFMQQGPAEQQGQADEPPAQEEPAPPEPPAPPVEAVDQKYQAVESKPPAEPELPPEVAEQDKKAAHAFGQLRQTNTQLKQELQKYEAMIDQFSQMFGLDPNLDGKAKAESLKQAITAYQAQKQGLPLEVVQKMQDYEARLKNVETKEIDFYNYEEFDKLQKTYGLTDTEVATFKQELLQNGVDWQNNKVRVALAYRDMHQSDIEARIAQRAVEEYKRQQAAEAGRQQKVEQHSTAPVQAQSPDDVPPSAEEQQRLQTMGDLNAWLRSTGFVDKV